MNLIDFRAISEGYSVPLVEAVGGDIIYQCIQEGANLQAIGIKTSALAKNAKDDMKNAKKLAKSDPKAAAKKYDDAINKLEQLKKECENIEDDHIAMVFIDSFVKSFIPIVAGCVGAMWLPSGVWTVAYLTGIFGGYICGMQKSLDFSAAVEKKMTSANKAGISGKPDSAVWWEVGQTRGATMVKFDRLITSCKKAKEKLGK